ncbi:dethiobiotin synthase [Soonwooa sp.]|uniref:dethiobiotin synthase n=1 Tax=Soonwooa sp. TaxID=1938592 RepID=UPI00262B1943|nr:dethiobiotin synthase [Soonwooa sp.]
MNNQKLFITGIGTGIGKTIVSAIFTDNLKADYWKPVQSGDLDETDSMKVKELVSHEVAIHPEKYQLQLAASPDKSAKAENIEIKLEDFKLPKTTKNLIVEGAGGLFVPLNKNQYIIDLIQKLNFPIVLVTSDYLGCINHTLLSLEALKNRNIELKYFVFNGDFDSDTENSILQYLDDSVAIIRIPSIKNLDKSSIKLISNSIKLY